MKKLKNNYNFCSYFLVFYFMQISQKIIDYAIWYYLRYYPSVNKLKRKLEEKFWLDSDNWKRYWGIGEREIDFIIEEKLRNIIKEEEVLKSKIRNYQLKNKNLNYIKQKLREKLFEKDMCDSILESEFLEAWESLLDENYLRKQIIVLKQKWKSKNYIRQKFIERSEDRFLVESIIEEIYLTWELEEIKKEFEKIKDKFENKKILEKLVRKWFSYSDIKLVINNQYEI